MPQNGRSIVPNHRWCFHIPTLLNETHGNDPEAAARLEWTMLKVLALTTLRAYRYLEEPCEMRSNVCSLNRTPQGSSKYSTVLAVTCEGLSQACSSCKDRYMDIGRNKVREI